MATRNFALTRGEIEELVVAFRTCRNGDTKIRYQAIRLYGQGYKVKEILAICNCCHRSLMDWCHAYRQGGIAALVDQRKGGNRAKLTTHQIEQLTRQLHQYTPAQLLGREQSTGPGDGAFWNVSDVAALLQRDYGVVFASNTSYYHLLARCDMTYQRPAKQYKSHSVAKLMVFEEGLEKKTA